MSKYSQAVIFTKRSNLLPYAHSQGINHFRSPEERDRFFEHYAHEQEVSLIALFRWEHDKCICRIKCPINPLPVKGEFEAASPSAISRFLIANGWAFKQKYNLHIFE